MSGVYSIHFRCDFVNDENYLVISLCNAAICVWQTMSTAVVQLYKTEGPAHSAWLKRTSGIACFVRDSSKRSYFIRVYCMVKHELAWEEEMYDSINVSKPREFLICFEGQVRQFSYFIAFDKIDVGFNHHLCLQIGLHGRLEFCIRC